MFDINKYMRYNRRHDGLHWALPVECNDGFTMSVQAHGGAYCSPRPNIGESLVGLRLMDFTEVEVGFPSEKEDLLMEYCEDINNPTDTVYAWVPVEIVNKVVESHGGLKGE